MQQACLLHDDMVPAGLGWTARYRPLPSLPQQQEVSFVCVLLRTGSNASNKPIQKSTYRSNLLMLFLDNKGLVNQMHQEWS
jgi:hypothetical protein